MNIGKPLKEDEYWPLENPVPVKKVEAIPIKIPLKEPIKEPIKEPVKS